MKQILPRIGDERIIERHLRFPLTIDREKRWDEVVYIRQYLVGLFDTYTLTWWMNLRWATKEEYDEYRKDQS